MHGYRKDKVTQASSLALGSSFIIRLLPPSSPAAAKLTSLSLSLSLTGSRTRGRSPVPAFPLRDLEICGLRPSRHLLLLSPLSLSQHELTHTRRLHGTEYDDLGDQRPTPMESSRIEGRTFVFLLGTWTVVQRHPVTDGRTNAAL